MSGPLDRLTYVALMGPSVVSRPVNLVDEYIHEPSVGALLSSINTFMSAAFFVFNICICLSHLAL